MHVLEIQGGVPLHGRVAVGGAKNAVLKLMAAALLTHEPCRIRRVPRIADVFTMVDVIRSIGAQVDWEGEDLHIEAREITHRPDQRLVESMRASIQVMGPLLARLGRAEVPAPGGCAIGSRPIDLHRRGLIALGAQEYSLPGGVLGLRATQLRGTQIYLDFPSVGATENIMTAAALIPGETEIHNAAKEPELQNLSDFLTEMGAEISGIGTGKIRVLGRSELKGAEIEVMPDRIETGTYLIAGAITGGEVFVERARAQDLEALLLKLTQAGVQVDRQHDGIGVRCSGPILPVYVKSLPYPGFATDLQPQMTSLLTQALGSSVVVETVFTDRLKHLADLARMGADVFQEGSTAIIRGPAQLEGCLVEATDLRGGAALVLAGLAARGKTFVTGVRHIDRGYQNLEERLSVLGAKIRRLE